MEKEVESIDENIDKVVQRVQYNSISETITLENGFEKMYMTLDHFYSLIELADEALQRKVNLKITIGK